MYERLGSYLWEAGDHGASERAYADAALLLAGAPPSAAAARLLAVRASKLVRDGHYAEGLPIGHAALAMARSVEARPEQGRALMWIGAGLIMQGDVDAGADNLREAVRIAESEHALEDQHRAYANLAYALENAGRVDQSLAVALEGLDLIRQTGVEHTRAFSLLANNACAAMVQLGRWDEVTTIITELLAARPVAESLFLRLTLAEIEVARGRFAAADELLTVVRNAGGGVTQPQFIASRCASAAEAATWQGRHPVARTAVADGLGAIAGTQHAVAVLRLCALGLRNMADEWLTRTATSPPVRPDPVFLSTMEKSMTDIDRASTPGPVLPDVSALLLLCRAERLRLDGADRVSTWSEVAEAWVTLGRPYPAGYARWREAEAAAHDSAADARPAAADAYQVARELDAVPLGKAVSALAQRIGLVLEAELTGPIDREETAEDPAPTSSADEFRLTRREREVLAHVCAGKTNRQIGKALSITESTVSVHVTNLMVKLGVPNRSAAAVKATELRLVQRPPAQ
jgi:DNA-binding CsgD family transcriptional regulator/tetratricopeptide (TPR) repeat protein